MYFIDDLIIKYQKQIGILKDYHQHPNTHWKFHKNDNWCKKVMLSTTLLIG